MDWRGMAAKLRAQALRAIVHRVDDAAETQRVDVETHAGVQRAGVEVLQPYGLASRPPGDGILAVVLAIGGDPGDLVALPLSVPAARFGKLAAGEVVIYDAGGNRVHLKAGGVVEIHAATKLRVVAPLVEMTGNLEVAGQVSDANGSMQEMRDRYNPHTHAGPGAGPSPQMD